MHMSAELELYNQACIYMHNYNNNYYYYVVAYSSFIILFILLTVNCLNFYLFGNYIDYEYVCVCIYIYILLYKYI